MLCAMKLVSALLAALALAVGCGADERRAVIVTREGEVSLEVELADTPEERRQGLMNRRSLPERSGMLFLYERDERGGFWMKDTLIPLSIAFIDADGRILRILDMEPCAAEPCPIYDAGVAYRAALEVGQGAFERLGVGVGDVVRLER
jgi:hypothetical protein